VVESLESRSVLERRSHRRRSDASADAGRADPFPPLRGRPVVALAERTAAIENPTGAITVYRKNNKPTLGPVGDSLDDLDPRGPR
jgi:hypothetical protein